MSITIKRPSRALDQYSLQTKRGRGIGIFSSQQSKDKKESRKSEKIWEGLKKPGQSTGDHAAYLRSIRKLGKGAREKIEETWVVPWGQRNRKRRRRRRHPLD